MRILAALLAASMTALLVCGPALAEQGDAEDRALIQVYVDQQIHAPADKHRASQSNESSTPAQEHHAAAQGPRATIEASNFARAGNSSSGRCALLCCLSRPDRATDGNGSATARSTRRQPARSGR